MARNKGQGGIRGNGPGSGQRQDGRQSPAGRQGGKGRMGGRAMGPGGDCICPECRQRAPHQRGTPCFEQKCPKCGIPMTRA